MASTDARPIPIKNTAFRVVFPILDADGDLVTGATGLDSEVSKDQGTFADCTNEATEIATASGLYYLDLTSTEMNADCVAVIVKTSSSGAKTTVLVFYPEETGDINVDVTAYGGTAATAASGRPEVNVSHIAGSAVSTSTAQLGVNVVNFGGAAGTFASGVPAVNATQLSGDSVAADNAESFFDGTGYAGTNNTIPTVTTLTNAPSDSSGVTTLLSRVPSGLFTGITSLAQWLGLIAGKQTGNTTARTEIRATGAGSGTFDETTDSQEALRDNMGTAQTGDAYARLGAPAGASVSADVAAVKAETATILSDTNDIQTRLPAALVGGLMASDVGSISGDTVAADNLEAAADGTGYNLGGGAVVAASVTGAAGSVTGAVGSVTGAVGSVTGNVGGNVAGSVGSVTGNVGGNVTGSVGSLATQAKADVNAEVLDVLNTDTFAEPGQEAPGATISLVKKIGYLYKAWRNKSTQTSSTYSLFADDTTTVDQKATVSDDGTTTTVGEKATGP